MYKALYSYTSTDENALSFSDGTLFTLIDSTKDKHWWLVQNGQGQLGFVPANYLQKDESSLAEVIKSVDRAITILRQTIETKEAKGECTAVDRNNLQKLQRHRANVCEEQRQERSHDINLHKKTQPTNAQTSLNKESSTSSSQKHRRSAPPPPPLQDTPVSTQTSNTSISNHDTTDSSLQNQANSNPAKTDSSSTSPKHNSLQENTNLMNSEIVNNQKGNQELLSVNDVHIPTEIGSELVEKLRNTAGISYNGSIEALHVVFSHVRNRVPELETCMNKILETIYVETESSKVDLTTDDAKRLEHIFEELANCKDDSQQRSWFLHEDEHIIQELLSELLSILNGANSDICKYIIAKDHFAAVDTLVVYYQMETRINLRMSLLQVFGTLCGLSSKVISELLTSVLPCELARDIQTDTQEIQKLCYSSLVLTMVFSQGEPVPLHFYTQLNELFVEYLLDNIEQPPESDVGGQVPDLFLKLVLAFNLHFQIPGENTVMKVIAKKGTAKTLTEKLMLLINRGDDPVRMFEHEPKPPNAVLKFLSDIYSSSSTSNLLYTNDVKVLIDIVLRMLTDLSAGESLRTEYLSIMELILKNHNYTEHHHRRTELELCFKKIYNEEEPSSEMDKRIVVQIWKDLPDLFEADCV